MNHRPEMEGMDREDSDVGKDMMDDVEMVEREHEGVVLMRHWTGDGVERHR
jgi:streptomycin 6-kinase